MCTYVHLHIHIRRHTDRHIHVHRQRHTVQIFKPSVRDSRLFAGGRCQGISGLGFRVEA